MKNKVTCFNCSCALIIDKKIRLNTSQENKEIINILERQGFNLHEFRYCEKTGFIESVIAEKECVGWTPN